MHEEQRETLGGVIRVHFFIRLSLRRWESTDIALPGHQLKTLYLLYCRVTNVHDAKYRHSNAASMAR